MVDKRQARVIDIDENARMGGTNFDLAVRHIRNGVYDFLIIKAGLGVWKSETFDEQRSLAEKFGIPYLTYHLVDPFSPNSINPKDNMRNQAKFYVDLVGKNQPTYFVDIEHPRQKSRLPSRNELNRYLSQLIQLTGKRPVLYTRFNIIKSITGFMKDAESYDLWIANYVEVKPGEENNEGLYRYFDDFLESNDWTLPPSIRGTSLEKKVIMWQFTKKGNGPHYIYEEYLGPDKEGKRSADLNISIEERDEFMKRVYGKIPDLPKAAPRIETLTTEQIEVLVQSGISPKVRVDLDVADLQVEDYAALQEMLNKSGIPPKIKVNLLANISE